MNENEKTFSELPNNVQAILLSIANECKRAESKHPHWPTSATDKEQNGMIAAAAILQEESGELISAAVQYDREGGSIGEVMKEAVQTGAMVVRLLKNIPGL